MRNFSADRPASRSQVHWTSLAVKGLPSCQVTPWCSEKVSSVPSSLHDHPVARSGTIDCRLFCFTCWSNMTRLLKTPIIGPSAKAVDSSRIDMLAGLSGLNILRTPPGFSASAGSAATPTSNGAAIAKVLRYRVISVHPPVYCRAAHCLSSSRESRNLGPGPQRVAPFPILFIEPDVFHAPAVVDAVGHQGQILDPGLAAGGAGREVEHRADPGLGEHALDLPDDLFAFFRVGLHRLPVNQLIEVVVAVPAIVP